MADSKRIAGHRLPTFKMGTARGAAAYLRRLAAQVERANMFVTSINIDQPSYGPFAYDMRPGEVVVRIMLPLCIPKRKVGSVKANNSRERRRAAP